MVFFMVFTGPHCLHYLHTLCLARATVHLIPNDACADQMCAAIGVPDVSALFDDIPASLRLDRLDLPDPEPERRMISRLRRLLGKNRTYDSMPIFLGGGCQPQLVPSAVAAVAHRQEIINAYTPYQPEVSQGLLQGLFEYQSLMADITRMEVVNSSMYDGHTALGEAGLMAARVHPNRPRLLVPASLGLDKRSVLANYIQGAGLMIEAYGYDEDTGEADLGDLERRLGDDVAAVVLENPNRFGVFEPRARDVGALAHDHGALFILGVEPTSLGAVMPPGLLGADIVVGEASGFGGAPMFGGPLLGLFATTEALVRKMPGRLIGATLDEAGRRGYVMTLQAREQHIRRAKATSNICTNEALMAFRAAIHLTMLGRTGLRTMSLQNLAAGERLATVLEEAGLSRRFTGAHYNEVVTRCDDVDALYEDVLHGGVHPGLRLGRDDPGLADCMLWGASPIHSDTDFQALQAALAAREVTV